MRIFRSRLKQEAWPTPKGVPVALREYAVQWLKTATLARAKNVDEKADILGISQLEDPRMQSLFVEIAEALVALQLQLRLFQSIRPEESDLFELHDNSLARWLTLCGNLDNVFAQMQAVEDKEWWNSHLHSRRSKSFERLGKIAEGDLLDSLKRLKVRNPELYEQFNELMES